MPKTINITDINIKDFSISYIDSKWNVSVVYSLKAEDGTELPAKREQITDFTAGQQNYLTNILNTLTAKIKQKEGI